MFVQVIEAQVRDRGAVEAALRRWYTDVAPGAVGFLGTTGGVTDQGRMVLVARFASEAAAGRNSDRPEQGEWWRRLAEDLDDVSFLDAVDPVVFVGGGSDDAGFVQVILSQTDDAAAVRDAFLADAGAARAARPDVIGALLATAADGRVAQIVWFTSEEEARRFEAATAGDPGAGVAPEATFHDLRSPWLEGPPVGVDDPAAFHHRAVHRFDRAVLAIGDGDWDRPTPCDDWSVRDLVRHVVEEDRWVPPLLEGRTIAEVGDRFAGDLLGDAPLWAWGSAATAASTAMAADGALDGAAHVSFGDIPASEYAMQVGVDHLVHAWDLARAVGADESLPDDLVAACATWFDGREDAYRASGAIGPAVDVADDADAPTRLLARFGRDAT